MDSSYQVVPKSWVRNAVLGYILLALGLGYALHENSSQAAADQRALTANRVEAVKKSCSADVDLAMALQKAVDGQIQFVKDTNEAGPPTVDQRVKSLQQLRATIPVPNCAARVATVKESPGG